MVFQTAVAGRLAQELSHCVSLRSSSESRIVASQLLTVSKYRRDADMWAQAISADVGRGSSVHRQEVDERSFDANCKAFELGLAGRDSAEIGK
jgi:hypothetical protein